MARTGPMAQDTDHWRRAVVSTLAGIFAVSLLGGLLGGLTGGGSLSAALRHAPQARTQAAAASATSPTTTARAHGALLALSDLPAGWVSGGVASAPTRTTPWSPALASCVGAPARLASLTPTQVSSPSFTSADRTLSVVDSTSAFGSAAQAEADYAAMADAKTPACMDTLGSTALRDSIQTRAGTGATVGAVAITALPEAWHAAHVTGFTVTIPLISGGRLLTITSTEVAFAKGAQVRQLTFNGNGRAFPALLEARLVQAAEHGH